MTTSTWQGTSTDFLDENGEIYISSHKYTLPFFAQDRVSDKQATFRLKAYYSNIEHLNLNLMIKSTWQGTSTDFLS